MPKNNNPIDIDNPDWERETFPNETFGIHDPNKPDPNIPDWNTKFKSNIKTLKQSNQTIKDQGISGRYLDPDAD